MAQCKGKAVASRVADLLELSGNSVLCEHAKAPPGRTGRGMLGRGQSPFDRRARDQIRL